MALGYFTYMVPASQKEDDGCARETDPELIECASKVIEAEKDLVFNNSSDIILQHPRHYQNYTKYCDESYSCLQRIKCKKVHEKFQTLPGCTFVRFYTNEFHDCAEQLYERRNEIECLDGIYNEQKRTEEETCEIWKSSRTTSCLRNAIESVCGDRLGIHQLKFVKLARQGDVIFCGRGSLNHNAIEEKDQKE